MTHKSFEQRVIARLMMPECVSQFMQAVHSKAYGADLDLNKVYERLHDDATVAEAARPTVSADDDYFEEHA